MHTMSHRCGQEARPLLIATSNQGKLQEYHELLEGLPFALVDQRTAGIDEPVEETGTTFEENARLKAETYASRSGMLTLADDSGIVVAALGGAPGLLSARYGGEGLDDIARYQLLLRNLEGRPPSERGARFVCVIALAAPGRGTVIVEGVVEGIIAEAPRGTNGFGYDPIFLLPDRGHTMAELDAEEKNRISHRARAAHQIRIHLEHMAGFGDEPG